MSFPRVPSLGDAARAEVRAAIGNAAARTGVNFNYLVAQAQSESGLNPTAKAQGSSASGLYQFLDQSWLAIVKRHGSDHGMDWAADAITARPGGGFRVDPNLRQAVMGLREQAGPAALMAASYAADNATGLGQALGRTANATDLYFAHFLGLQGATRFLRAAGTNPDANAAALFPREARANQGIFFGRDGSARSLGEVYALMGRKLDKAGAADTGSPAATVPQDPIAPPPEMARLQLAYADVGGGESLAEGADAGDGVAALLQQANRARMDVLRPTPAQARLAYLMLAMPTA